MQSQVPGLQASRLFSDSLSAWNSENTTTEMVLSKDWCPLKNSLGHREGSTVKTRSSGGRRANEYISWQWCYFMAVTDRSLFGICSWLANVFWAFYFWDKRSWNSEIISNVKEIIRPSANIFSWCIYIIQLSPGSCHHEQLEKSKEPSPMAGSQYTDSESPCPRRWILPSRDTSEDNATAVHW